MNSFTYYILHDTQTYASKQSAAVCLFNEMAVAIICSTSLQQ
jgi:hypothetical protein